MNRSRTMLLLAVITVAATWIVAAPEPKPEKVMPDRLGYCVSLVDKETHEVIGRVLIPFENPTQAGLEATRNSVRNAIKRLALEANRNDIMTAAGEVTFSFEPQARLHHGIHCVCATWVYDPNVVGGGAELYDPTGCCGDEWHRRDWLVERSAASVGLPCGVVQLYVLLAERCDLERNGDSSGVDLDAERLHGEDAVGVLTAGECAFGQAAAGGAGDDGGYDAGLLGRGGWHVLGDWKCFDRCGELCGPECDGSEWHCSFGVDRTGM